MRINVTKQQMTAIIDMKDDMSAMIGGADEDVDELWRKRVNLINRMLTSNGIEIINNIKVEI